MSAYHHIGYNHYSAGIHYYWWRLSWSLSGTNFSMFFIELRCCLSRDNTFVGVAYKFVDETFWFCSKVTTNILCEEEMPNYYIYIWNISELFSNALYCWAHMLWDDCTSTYVNECLTFTVRFLALKKKPAPIHSKQNTSVIFDNFSFFSVACSIHSCSDSHFLNSIRTIQCLYQWKH